MDRLTLEEILKNDPLEVLKDVKPKAKRSSEEQRLIDSFEAINEFYDKNGCEPQKNTNISERQLASKLEGYRKDSARIKILKPYDKHNLLEEKELKKVSSIDEILNSDILDVLNESDEDIFTLKHIPKIDKEKTDFVARREVCKDFDNYEHLFIQCQKDLKEGKRKLVKFNEQFFEEGNFFVLNGVLTYLDKIYDLKKDKNSKLDGRTKTIFENGTYSNMLLRSLGKGLYENGYFVSNHEDKILDKLSGINEKDKSTGYIYILKSRSNDEKISTIKDLYKIGFSTTTVEDRIKNARNEATYLFADVDIVAVFEAYNINIQKFENLIHRFFNQVRLDMKISDEYGKLYTPREWFVVNLGVIEKAIELLISGEIINYKYDYNDEKIISL